MGLNGNSSSKHIAISVTEGRTVRDLFYNGLLDDLTQAGFSITVFTEAFRVPEFVNLWKRPNIEFAPLLPCEPTLWRSRAFWLRRRVAGLGNRQLLNAYLRLEHRYFYSANKLYADMLTARRPSVLLTTHAHLSSEVELIATAHKLKIPTLGIVRSWDNVYKGIRSRPQQLAVWNEINKQEVIDYEGYEPEKVHLVGAPQFDPYFARDTIWSKERLCEHFRLDPNRPIILFATLGYFFPGFDETCWMDALMSLIDRGDIDGRPQVICRLHPWSRLEHFQKYSEHQDVRLSYVDRYWPGLTWYMTKDDVVNVANMLSHASVVITPGSTITLEAAVFDTPTVVPIFHSYQPERARDYFKTWVLGKHFGRIEQLDLVPIIRDAEQYAPAINRCLNEPDWYRTQRKQLVREYVNFTDGLSTRRIADLAVKIASNGISL